MHKSVKLSFRIKMMVELKLLVCVGEHIHMVDLWCIFFVSNSIEICVFAVPKIAKLIFL